MFISMKCLSCIEDNESFRSLLVHDPVSTFPASNGVSRPNLVLAMTFAANVNHRRSRRCAGSGRTRCAGH